MTVSQLRRWKGQFGKAYTDRNALSIDDFEKTYTVKYGTTRTALNKLFLNKINRSARVIEVGSNIGTQLLCLQKMGFKNLYGIEPQNYAAQKAKENSEGINVIKGDAFDIPFKDGYFDIVFTSGVLIHINPKDIKKALKEIYRCSAKYIWGFEYYSDKYEEIPYRGKKNLLWKTNFAKIYTDTFPDLKIIKIKLLKYLENDNIDSMFLLERKNA